MTTAIYIKDWAMPVVKDANVCDCQKEPVLMTYKTAVIFWLVEVGDKVTKDDVIAEGEIEKKTIKIEAPCSGVLEKICINNGEKAGTCDVLGYIKS